MYRFRSVIDHSVLHVPTAGMYANFAGRDASRGMAKQSFDDGACTISLPQPGTEINIPDRDAYSD